MKIIYKNKLLKLIESFKNEEVYPKHLDVTTLAYELVNLYVGWFFINSSIEKEDKEFLVMGVMPDIVTHIVQSIFYDSIGHYDQELDSFWGIYTDLDIDGENAEDSWAVLYDEYKDLLKDNKLTTENKEILEETLQEIKKVIEEIKTAPDLQLLDSFTDALGNLFDIDSIKNEQNLDQPIDDWINKMKQIPKDLWEEFAYYFENGSSLSMDFLLYTLDNNLVDIESIYKESPNIFNDFFDYYKGFINDSKNQSSIEVAIFHYMDYPYYEGFYNGLLPLYNEFKAYLLDPTVNTFNKVMSQIDHVKDLQHHSNFFWNTLPKETMDFISHAKISDLLKYVSDSDIKNIYKKYYSILNV